MRKPTTNGRTCVDRRVPGALKLPHMDRQQEFVLRTLEERDIRFVRLWFTDVLGYLKSVAVAPAAVSQGSTWNVEGSGRATMSDS